MSSLKALIVYNTLFAKLRFKYVTLCEFPRLLQIIPQKLQKSPTTHFNEPKSCNKQAFSTNIAPFALDFVAVALENVAIEVSFHLLYPVRLFINFHHFIIYRD